MNHFDKSRRKSLKLIATGAAAVTGAMLTSGAGAAANLEMRSSGMSITVYDNAIGHTILVKNQSGVTRKLKAIQPNKVFSGDQAIDLKKLFLNGDLVVPANTTQAFYMSENW